LAGGFPSVPNKARQGRCRGHSWSENEKFAWLWLNHEV